MERNCIIGQSGGPTVAINSTLAGVIRKAHQEGFAHCYGMINGVMGLLEGKYFDLFKLDEKMIHQLKYSPAMYLGSCRYKLPDASQNEEPYHRLFGILDKLNITDFFYIGGNDSMDTVSKMSAYAKTINSPIHIIGLPKTIDNDLMGTDHTPGFGSAAKYVASSMLEIAYDSSIYKLDAVTIVEIMGRNAGWLTAASALARSTTKAPDLIYLPETPFDQDRFLKDIEKKFEEKSSIIIAVSEGIKDENGRYLDSHSSFASRDVFGNILHSGTGKTLETIVRNHFGCKVRSIELNVLQRCAMHIASRVDLEEAYKVGEYAVVSALKGQTGVMVIIERIANTPYESRCRTMPVDEIANVEHKIPLEWITEEHNDITEELYQYLYPLIQGEVEVSYKNGIPSYIDISHLNI